MVDVDKYYFEFSKIYGRLMRLEMQIKQMLISSVLSYYKDDVIDVFEKFFYNKNRIARYNNKKGNTFLAILKNPQITKGSQKFIRLVNIMYLSDLLFMVLCCEQFRKEGILNKFYFKVPEKFGGLVKSRETLLDLRNAIAHFKFKDYEQNKQKYLDVLLKFESCMGWNIRGFLEFPKFDTKPTVHAILLKIKEIRPDLFDIDPNKDDEMEYYYNKHRILLDLCDEIALYNGYEAKDLPSPWTVLRQMYAIKHENKRDKENSETDISKFPLFKNLKDK